MTRKEQTQEALSPETFAVLACAQAVVHPRLRARFRAAIAACPSVERLCEIAVRHGMLGHVCKMASADEEPPIAPEVRGRLAALYRTSAERNLRQTARLLRLLELLQARGIAALPIKGPALAERLYGDVTLRNWVDLDLVVRYEDVPAARAALLGAGFADSSPYNERLMRRRTRTEGEIAVHATDDDLLVDLHWQMGVGYGADALTGEALLARAEPATLLGREVLAPSAVDMLLLTCLHGTRHRWDSVEGILAVVLMVLAMTDGEWRDAVAGARAAGCLRRLSIAWFHGRRLMCAARGGDARLARRLDPTSRLLAGLLKPWVLQRDDPLGLKDAVEHVVWTLGSEDSVVAAVQHVAVRLLQPGPEDWSSVRLPQCMDRVYVPLRPLRLGVKWLTRALEAS